jgi:hypothetical protein
MVKGLSQKLLHRWAELQIISWLVRKPSTLEEFIDLTMINNIVPFDTINVFIYSNIVTL